MNMDGQEARKYKEGDEGTSVCAHTPFFFLFVQLYWYDLTASEWDKVFGSPCVRFAQLHWKRF